MERHELETVIYEKDGPIARIILNRPEKANSQNSPMVWDVENSLKDAEADYAIKVVILKANGRGFCAGHDVGGPGSAFPGVRRGGGGRPSLGRTGHPVPVAGSAPVGVPEANGCRRAGLLRRGRNLLRTAQRHRRGVRGRLLPDAAAPGPGFPGGETMVEPWVMMNFHHAYEYLYLSQTVDAQEAHRLGMVNRVVPRDELDETVELIAQQIAQAPLSVLMGIKAGVKRAWEGMGMRVHLQSHLQVMQLSAAPVTWPHGDRRTGKRATACRRARWRPGGPRWPPKQPDQDPATEQDSGTMSVDLHNRSFLKELDFSAEELVFLLDLSRHLKATKRDGCEQKQLVGKNIALIFEKTSTRTRCAFEVAAYDQGAHVTYLGPDGTQIGHKESIRTRPGCWAECSTPSSIAAISRPRSKNWPATPVCRSTTA